MQKITNIGGQLWDYNEIRSKIPEFLKIYYDRPISSNEGGMRLPHLFAFWFMLKKINPEVVIESGVWKGLGTWIIEKALPCSTIYCIDVNLEKREYVSPRAIYFNKDFTTINWDMIKYKNNAILFFDDHQNAIGRLKKGKKFGFKKFIFEDNYPRNQGDCFSLKKGFSRGWI